jgi:type II secretory pathway pseudopilin PulG
MKTESRIQNPESRSPAVPKIPGGGAKLPLRRRRSSAALPVSGFTMVEIAISLAVIGIALVSIIGVLPIGMHTQRDNREETVINQDATILMEAIRGGARGLDDLTNYVYDITNTWTEYNNLGVVLAAGGNNYTFTNAYIALGYYNLSGAPITNGMNIVGLLTTPEYTDNNGLPIPTLIYGGYSNHIVAYVRSMSGPAVEKPPQDNAIVVGDSFGYRVLCVNAPVAADTNMFFNASSNYVWQLTANLHELRLAFFWPQQPNGSLGPGRQTFRTMVAGQIIVTNNNIIGGPIWYFYQPQSFTGSP